MFDLFDDVQVGLLVQWQVCLKMLSMVNLALPILTSIDIPSKYLQKMLNMRNIYNPVLIPIIAMR